MRPIDKQGILPLNHVIGHEGFEETNPKFLRGLDSKFGIFRIKS